MPHKYCHNSISKQQCKDKIAYVSIIIQLNFAIRPVEVKFQVVSAVRSDPKPLSTRCLEARGQCLHNKQTKNRFKSKQI